MARARERVLTRLDPERYEQALHGRLLAADPRGVAVGDALFELLMETAAEPLWRAVGARLAGHPDVARWARAALLEGYPAWRLQPLCADAEVAALLREGLMDREPRTRVAALKGLAPRVTDPQVRREVLRCLADANDHVVSTALELLRSVVGEPEVSAAILALFAREEPLPGRVDRALRRCLRAASGDLAVQRTLIAGLRARRAHIAAQALAGAPASEDLADELLAVLATTRHIFTVGAAFEPVAHLPRVTAAVLPMLADRASTNYQTALRIVGRGVGDAARDALIDALNHETNWQRWTALEQLERRLGDPVARAAVIGCLRDADDSVRMIALKILTTWAHDPDVRGVARERLADPSPAVAVAAAGLLARGSPDAAAWAVLAPHVTSRSRGVYTKQWRSIEPLAQVATLVRLDEVRDALADMLRDTDASRVARAARVLQDASPCGTIAEALAECAVHGEPVAASAAYSTLLAWTR